MNNWLFEKKRATLNVNRSIESRSETVSGFRMLKQTIGIGYILPLLILLLLAPLSVNSQAESLKHPENLFNNRRAMCLQCHDNSETFYNRARNFQHSEEFVKNHNRFAANRQTCALCHKPSFCVTCHNVKNNPLPSIRLKGQPERFSIHPSGWLSIHQIEGRSNPGECYKCHSSDFAGKCSVCHRNKR